MRLVALLAVAGLSQDPVILHFYAYPAQISRGERASICYGVENTSQARIDPQPGGVPAFARRCVEVRPRQTTEYVLSAQGAGGRRVSRTLKVVVRAPAAKPAPPAPPGPRITSFTATPSEVPRDGLVTLCFETTGAAKVSLEPPVVGMRLPQRGCFGDTPRRTTTYRLTASGPDGSDTREVSVTVR